MRWTKDGAESVLHLRRLWVAVPDTDFGMYARSRHNTDIDKPLWAL